MKSKPFGKVYAITPNPALDLSGSVESIVENEKNYVFQEKRFPGGNSVNSARILNRLNCSVVAGGFLGGSIGEEVMNLLRREKVRCDFVGIRGNTRVNVSASNQSTHKQTRFSFTGPDIESSEKSKLLKKLSSKNEGGIFLLGGSFPGRFGIRHAARIINMGHKKSIATVVDVPSNKMSGILKCRPLMIKPNLLEFEQLVGKTRMNLPQIRREAEALLRFCPAIFISSVNDGVLLVTKKASFFASGPRVQAKSSVGAGDSMVGAIVAGMVDAGFSYSTFFGDDGDESLEANKSWPAILSLGLGAAIATIKRSGSELGTAADILHYARKVKVETL